jgi:CDP-6-deoxy-D-xylo-4-hexulose-3-dehydrase
MYPLIHDTWSQDELNAISKVIKSNRFSMGPEVKEFELKFAEHFGSQFAVCVNSGSSANFLALSALRFFEEDDRDEVIVPAIAWSTTYSPLYYLGYKPVFVDVGIDTFNIDPVQIISRVTSKTKAIVSVNLLGKSADYEKLIAICRERNIHLIEDNCESMGAKFGEKYCGTIGLAGTFSFFYSHHITTIEGGMVLTNSKRFADICISLRAHGWLRELDKDSHLYDNEISDFRKMFWFVLPGYNLRPIEFTGAIGLEQLKKFPEFLKARKVNHRHFIDLMKGLPKFFTQAYDEGHSAFSFPMVLKESNMILKEQIVSLLRESGIESRPIASGDVTRHPFIKYFKNVDPGSVCVNARHIDDNGFMVGNHPADIRKNLDQLFEICQKI